jgi:hypothetical protein
MKLMAFRKSGQLTPRIAKHADRAGGADWNLTDAAFLSAINLGAG